MIVNIEPIELEILKDKCYRNGYVPCYNWVKIENDEIVDMAVGNSYAGCRCDSKEKVKTCANFKICLQSIYDKCSDENKTIIDKFML